MASDKTAGRRRYSEELKVEVLAQYDARSVGGQGGEGTQHHRRRRAEKHAAAVMSLIHSAKLNGLDPDADRRDVLDRLPTQRANRRTGLPPHRCKLVPCAAYSQR